MKKVLGLMICFLLLLMLPLLGSAETSGTCGANLTWALQDDGTLVISGTGAMYSSRNDWTGSLNTDEVYSIQINSGVTSIGNHAFHNCVNASGTVDIPGTVRVISTAAFSHCTALTKINLPDSLTNIQGGAFHTYDGVYQRNAIPALRVVPTIGGNAANALSKADYSFRHESYPLIDLQYLYDGETQTDFAIISANTSIKEVKWPEGITKISSDAFKNCKSLAAIDIPASVNQIDGHAFLNCTELKAVDIPKGVSVIRYETFQGCSSLISLTIPDTVTTIEQGAFSHCTALTKINLPDSLTNIQGGAFHTYDGVYQRNAIPALRVVPTIGGNAANALSKAGYSFRHESYPLIDLQYLYDGETQTDFAIISANTDITEVKWPEGITKISANAFKNCKSLAAIDIPATVNQIDGHAFLNCTELKAVDIPKGVSVIRYETFQGCSNLISVTIPDTVTSIEQGAFSHCSSLKELRFSDNLTVVQGGAFHTYDGSYQRGEIPAARFAPTLNGSAAMALSSAGYSFREDDYPGILFLYKLDAEGSVAEFRAVGADSTLAAATVPKTVTHIGKSAFAGCADLTSITLPASLKQIEQNAFKGLTKMKYVYYEGSKADWAKVVIDEGNDPLTTAIILYDGSTKIPVTSITLNETNATLVLTPDNRKPTLQLTAKVEPEEAADPSVEWTSSDASIASVDETGLVTGLKAGTVTISCTAKEDSGISATCEITITEENNPVASITLNKTKATLTRTSSSKKPTLRLTAEVGPEDAADRSVEWTSSNPKVAKVDQNGKVTALKKGTAVITCAAKDGSGVKATCKITVKDKLVSKITLNKKKVTIKLGKTFQLKVTKLSPANALNQKVTWKSSDTKIATVDKNGKVKAKKKGTCTITCTAKDGSGKKATCKITVK